MNEKETENLKLNLLQNKGITSVETNFNEIEKKILIETNLPSALVQKKLEVQTNAKSILRGIGSSRDSTSNKFQQTAAVSIISNFNDLIKPIRGVVRFVQLDDKNCAIDGTIDGLKPGFHAINVCEYGDISSGCESTGNHWNPYNKKHGLPNQDERHAGDLGNIESNKHEMSSFRLIDKQLKVWDIIGRSFCVYEKNDDGNEANCGKKIACGIIARSAGLFENMKKICLCSGRTLWEERDLFDIQKSKI